MSVVTYPLACGCTGPSYYALCAKHQEARREQDRYAMGIPSDSIHVTMLDSDQGRDELLKRLRALAAEKYGSPFHVRFYP